MEGFTYQWDERGARLETYEWDNVWWEHTEDRRAPRAQSAAFICFLP